MGRKKEFVDRDSEIFNLRYVEGWTLQKIGNEFGITRERVRQIVDEILAELELL